MLAVTAFACAGGASTAGAQSRLGLDLAGTRIEYDTLPALNAPSVAALSEWQRSSIFARLSGSVTGFQDSGWSAQGRGDLAGWLAPFGVASPLRLELGGNVGGARHSSGFDSFLGRGDARLHLRSGAFGAWAGASVASARNSFDSAAVSGLVPNAGVWAQSRYLRGTVSYQHTRMSGDSYPEANAALTLSRGPADLTLYAGVRDAPYATTGWNERWAGISAVWWVSPNAALVVSGGGYSSDVLQGLPGGDFASVGLRLTPRRVRPIPITAPSPIVYTSEEARRGSIGFEVEGAARVEIAGDWNGWELEPLTRDASGRWVVPAGTPVGVHRFNLRVDGERWFVPEGVPAVDDGFGGQVGLLVVSGP
ncbi:MAG: hypothetical protein FJ207_12555 [Gemmatimonadetes bacterium]|nr:hypothetical protein [Gemmatimonadota bacterium]